MKDLPDWAVNMTEEEWKKLGQEQKGYTNCTICGKRLILTLCRYKEPEFYCVEHCPEHKWQTTFDWPNECARCGIRYNDYLESVLKKHGIEYNSRVDDKI